MRICISRLSVAFEFIGFIQESLQPVTAFSIQYTPIFGRFQAVPAADSDCHGARRAASRQCLGICSNPQTSTSNRLTGWAAVTIHRWAAKRPPFITTSSHVLGSRVTGTDSGDVTDSEVSHVVFLQPRVMGLRAGRPPPN